MSHESWCFWSIEVSFSTCLGRVVDFYPQRLSPEIAPSLFVSFEEPPRDSLKSWRPRTFPLRYTSQTNRNSFQKKNPEGGLIRFFLFFSVVVVGNGICLKHGLADTRLIADCLTHITGGWPNISEKWAVISSPWLVAWYGGRDYNKPSIIKDPH